MSRCARAVQTWPASTPSSFVRPLSKPVTNACRHRAVCRPDPSCIDCHGRTSASNAYGLQAAGQAVTGNLEWSVAIKCLLFQFGGQTRFFMLQQAEKAPGQRDAPQHSLKRQKRPRQEPLDMCDLA